MVEQIDEDPEEVRRRALEIVAVFKSVPMDFSGSAKAWRYGGGRDLSRLAEKARYGRPDGADGSPEVAGDSP